MADEFDKIKNLSPRERISRLKKIAKKKEEEIKKAQHLIKESESELIAESKKEIPIPEERKIDISELFERGEELEQILSEVPKFEVPEDQIQYQAQLARELAEGPAANIYQLTRGIYEEFQESGELTDDQKTLLRAAREATQQKMDSIRSGDYLPSTQSANEMVASLKIAKFMGEMYKA